MALNVGFLIVPTAYRVECMVGNMDGWALQASCDRGKTWDCLKQHMSLANENNKQGPWKLEVSNEAECKQYNLFRLIRVEGESSLPAKGNPVAFCGFEIFGEILAPCADPPSVSMLRQSKQVSAVAKLRESTVHSPNPVWEWQDDSVWKKYDTKTSKELESVYHGYCMTSDHHKGLHTTRKGLVIDLQRWKQLHRNTGPESAVRRTVGGVQSGPPITRMQSGPAKDAQPTSCATRSSTEKQAKRASAEKKASRSTDKPPKRSSVRVESQRELKAKTSHVEEKLSKQREHAESSSGVATEDAGTSHAVKEKVRLQKKADGPAALACKPEKHTTRRRHREQQRTSASHSSEQQEPVGAARSHTDVKVSHVSWPP